MPRTHGTDSGYQGGCRCTPCREAHAKRLREYFRRNGGRYRFLPKHQRECAECGATWQTTNPKARFCSNACQAVHEHGPNRRPKSRRARRLLAASTRLAKAAEGTHGTRTFIAGWCAKCGVAAVGMRRAAVFFCSGTCRRRDRSFIRRAGRGQINRQAIYQRDGFRCRIPRCLFTDRRVAKSQKVPHPKAAVLDHIIPPDEARRLGMTLEEINAPANLRCAHFACNSSRRELGGNDQLALTG